VFPSAWIAGGIKKGSEGPLREWFSGFPDFARKHAFSGIFWIVSLLAVIVFGLVSPLDYSKDPVVKVALVQPNSDPWLGGIDSYRRDFNTLTRLSDQALKANSGIDMVVWPETAFIPRIYWHYRYRRDQDSYELVSQLLDYLNKAPVPYVLGNDDAVMGRTWEGKLDRVDYNAVFVFRPGQNVIPPNPDRYRKMKLVPFTEYFPYQKIFPQIYQLLVNYDTHFWEEGHDPVVFSVAGLKFSTPICFEDTFGYISREFVNNGARAIINLTNDAWAKSLPCQYQHLSMAVFRTVENRVPLVRSTASGQTCIVDPNGKILAMATPQTETYLVGTIPVLPGTGRTLYDVWGDLWGILFAVSAALVLVAGLLAKFRHLNDK
jgi:apolipoprotein N-acyltransferase